jgi:hypothetical protein
MKIARIFPTKTSMSPTDVDAYFDAPDLFTPIYDEVHISVTFTWDKERAEKLQDAWQSHAKAIYTGGPAVDGESDKPFQAGMYLKKGITITSRGCPNHCSFCMVNKGKLTEFDDFPEGNIVQDNNLLACSDRHLDLVWSMLKKQKGIELKGGLESSRITPKIARTLRGLRIKSLWFACDCAGAIEPLRKAVEILNNIGFTRNHLFCYVLCGKDMAEEENRLRSVFKIGCLPFAQLYRNEEDNIEYSREWKQFQRTWSRPAAFKTLMKTTR